MESWEKQVNRKAKWQALKEKIYLNTINIDAPFINAFSTAHILYLAAFFVILISMFIFRDFIQTNQVVIGRFLFVVSVLQQILLYSWYYFETKFDLKQALPLHICRLSTIMGLIYLVTGNQMVMQVLFYFGLYAYFSFFMPSRINKIYHVSGLELFFKPCHYNFDSILRLLHNRLDTKYSWISSCLHSLCYLLVYCFTSQSCKWRKLLLYEIPTTSNSR